MFEDVKELSNFIRRNRRDAFGIRNAYYKVLDKLGLLDEKKKAQAMWAKAYREAMKNSDAEYEDGNKYSRKFDKKKKSWYSEYRTNAMIWAFATDRKPGDTTIMSTDYDGYALLEATNDGYVEIKKGSYKEVKAEYERAYKNATNEVYGNTESFEADQGRDIWDLQYDEDGRNGSRNNQKIKSQGFQNDTSRNDEHLRSSNKRKSVSGTRVEESENLKEENARLRAELENIHLQLEQAEGKI